MSDYIELMRGSDNVFTDFGHANPEAEQLKATLAAQIVHVLDARPDRTRRRGTDR